MKAVIKVTDEILVNVSSKTYYRIVKKLNDTEWYGNVYRDKECKWVVYQIDEGPQELVMMLMAFARGEVDKFFQVMERVAP